MRTFMHELSIATILVNSLLEFMQKQAAHNKLVEVHVTVRKLRAISIEQLIYSYKILTRGTLLSETKFIVDETPATLHCSSCDFKDNFELVDNSFHFQLPTLSCPSCGATLNLEGGDELVISRVRMYGPPRRDAAIRQFSI
jgi:Zn finger protein HypA/HybF involved in hydrogenase expression